MAEGTEEEQADKEIADAVNEIVGDAGDPPGERHGRSPDEKIGDSAQRPEEQAERGSEHAEESMGCENDILVRSVLYRTRIRTAF